MPLTTGKLRVKLQKLREETAQWALVRVTRLDAKFFQVTMLELGVPSFSLPVVSSQLFVLSPLAATLLCNGFPRAWPESGAIGLEADPWAGIVAPWWKITALNFEQASLSIPSRYMKKFPTIEIVDWLFPSFRLMALRPSRPPSHGCPDTWQTQSVFT